MHRYLKWLIVWKGVALALLFAVDLLAARASANSDACSTIASASDVLRCVKLNHPELQRALLRQRQGSKLEDAASQIPNPEVDGKFGARRLNPDASLTTEIALMQPLEIGGKRGSRMDRARAESRQIDAELRETQEEVSSRTMLELHRLRQIEEELLVLAETVETFQRQTKILGGRQVLTPDQDVSSSVFALAHEDSSLKYALLSTERDRLVRSLQLSMGSEVAYGASWLPEEPRNWPDLKESSAEPAEPSSVIQKSLAEIDLAQADLSLAQASSWPDLKLGPFFESENAGGVRTSSLGVQVSFALPIFNINGGGRAVGYAGLDRAQVSAQLTSSASKNERTREFTTYQSLIMQLRKSKWHEQYQLRHKRVENLFKRGILASALVVEAHRQIIEVQRTSHEIELRALEALYRVRILDGTLPEASL